MDLELRRFENSDQMHEARVDSPADGGGSETQGSGNPLEFRPNEFVVYAAHGVGQILAIEAQTVGSGSQEFFVIDFAKSKMRARVPTQKAASIGMRKLSSPAAIEQACQILSQAASRARINWSRLTKEYATKIKSGNVIALAEVMRDLHRRAANSEQSYSERLLYAAALNRLSGEAALVQQITQEKAVLELERILIDRPGRIPNGQLAS
jgi:CarD family transcriptional regulator